ncbi:MAG: hypothetical protein ACLQAT_09695 [Candidatus Binataceae bacterium]
MHLEVSIICDDIRTEEGHKLSLMGIYDEALLLAQIPGKLLKLSLYQRWRDVPRGATVKVELRGNALPGPSRLEAKADTPAKGKEANEDAAAETPTMGVSLLIGFGPLDIIAEGYLEFVTFWEGGSSPSHVHRMRVSTSVASPPA